MKTAGVKQPAPPQKVLTSLPTVLGFYDDPVMQDRIRAEAASWIGTPFVPHSMIKGAGVDCVSLCMACYRATGFLKPCNRPTYPISSAALEDSLLIQWIEKKRRFKGIVGDPQPGDLLCFRVDRIVHHAGLYVGDSRFVHARRFRGVITSSLRDSTYDSRLVMIYRPAALAP